MLFEGDWLLSMRGCYAHTKYTYVHACMVYDFTTYARNQAKSARKRMVGLYRTASLLRPARCYAPPPPIFGRNYCKGLFYLHYTPPPAGRSSRFAVLQFCTCTRVASVEELYMCIKRVENSLRTGLGPFR